MKFLAKLSVVILILGGIFFGIGNAMGGTVYSSWYDGHLHPWHESRNIGFLGLSDRGFLHHAIHANMHEIPSTLPTLPYFDIENIWGSHVKNLELELGCGTYAIQRGTEFSISGTGLEQLEAWEDADTYYISYSGSGLHDAAANRTVTITIPEGIDFDNIVLDIGAANVTLGSFTAHEMRFSIGAGKLLSTAPLTVDTLEVEVGAGSASLQLSDSWNTYQCDAETAIGSITVNGDTLLNSFAGEASGGDGPHELYFTVGVGQIEITTKQDEG